MKTKISAMVISAMLVFSAVTAEAAGFSESASSQASRFSIRQDNGTPSAEFSEAQNYHVLSYVGGTISNLQPGVLNYCFHRNRLFEIQYLRSFTPDNMEQAAREYKNLVSQLTGEFGKPQSTVETDISQNYWDSGETLVFTRMSEENGLILIKAELGRSDMLEDAANYSGTLLLLPALKSGTAQFSNEGAVYYSEEPAEAEATEEAAPAEASGDKTPSGIAVTAQQGTYQTTSNLNLREDASTNSKIVTTAKKGTLLTGTGVCENGWIRVDYNGTTCYVIDDYVTLTK